MHSFSFLLRPVKEKEGESTKLAPIASRSTGRISGKQAKNKKQPTERKEKALSQAFIHLSLTRPL
uniref:Uncharacterized protein n=1 Tax=Picea glauca TaxID=3330 RepID=A0A101LYK1_PICGL|nr:hypothetical protein ABT39_MTgene5931 [Picea glauca]